ncbi:hypothetical protein BKA81DRAFT_24985 [Phyllosticta paracitricarpa]|uniref:F-box domain-containing protein n=2 Tax=Phyllosticta TaxID=121621 RepID=A0ABR1MEM5_9PEZI
MSASRFPQLTDELKDTILAHCDIQTLKSARSTCRAFVLAASRHLFGQIEVDLLEPASTEAFLKVAANARLASCIKRVVVAIGVAPMSFPHEGYQAKWRQFFRHMENLPVDGLPQVNEYILRTVKDVIHAVEGLPNLESFSCSSREQLGEYKLEGGDHSMNVFLLGIGRRLHNPAAAPCRTFESLQWTDLTKRSFDNVWAHQLKFWKRNAPGGDPPVPAFLMFKHLDLCNVLGYSVYDYSDDEEDDDDDDDNVYAFEDKDSEDGEDDGEEEDVNSEHDFEDNYDYDDEWDEDEEQEDESVDKEKEMREDQAVSINNNKNNKRPTLGDEKNEGEGEDHDENKDEDYGTEIEEEESEGEDDEAAYNKQRKTFAFIKARLSKLCAAKTNALESLRMDFQIDSCKPTDFLNQDSLKAFQGFALSPHLSKVSLSHFVTSSDCLLAFLRRISPTLRHLTLDYALLSRVRDIVGDRAVDIREAWIMDRDFPAPDTIYTWDAALPPLRAVLSAAPHLSSLHLRRLVDSASIKLGAESNGDDDYDGYDDDDDVDDELDGRVLLDSDACTWFAAHQANAVRDYLLGRTDDAPPPPVDPAAFFKLHAVRAGCALCGQMVRAKDRNVRKRTPKGKLVTFDSSIEHVRRVLGNRCGAGLSDEGVVYDL